MKSETLYQGLQDILAGRIAPEAIIDMAPYIRAYMPSFQIAPGSIPILGDNYVYIAGKVTGMNYDKAFERFSHAEQLLRNFGHKTINPMRIINQNCAWEPAMCIGIVSMVKHCNKIYLLDNWFHSKGARIEKQLAELLGYENIEISDTLNYAI